MGKHGFCAALAAAILIVLTGCSQTGLTKPPRSASEQLLISTATDRALQQASFAYLSGKKVFVEKAFLENQYDKEYVLGAIRDYISQSGGRLVAKVEDSEIVVEPRSGALSIDASSSLIGIPESSAPLPLAGSVQIPEMALFKSEKQFSIAKLAILAYDQTSREHILSTGPLIGRANIKYYKFLGFIKYNKTTVPEKKRQKEQK